MDPKTTSLANITPEDLARALTAASGRQVRVEEIRTDIELGAPVNPDGTMHLVNYMAWMLKERKAGREGSSRPPTDSGGTPS